MHGILYLTCHTLENFLDTRVPELSHIVSGSLIENLDSMLHYIVKAYFLLDLTVHIRKGSLCKECCNAPVFSVIRIWSHIRRHVRFFLLDHLSCDSCEVNILFFFVFFFLLAFPSWTWSPFSITLTLLALSLWTWSSLTRVSIWIFFIVELIDSGFD